MNVKNKKSLYGLVLAGGKSTRMGKDKGSIIYHEQPQREHLANLMKIFCEKVYISCRKEQTIQSDFDLLVDQYENVGPIGGLMTAFEKNPEVSWLVIACDLPLMDEQGISILIKNRSTHCLATVFQHPATLQLEPLVAIWEKESYPILKEYFEKGNRSPKRFLEKNKIQQVKPARSFILMNANFPDQMDQILSRIREEKTS